MWIYSIFTALITASLISDHAVRVYFEYPWIKDIVEYKHIGTINESQIYIPTRLPSFEEHSLNQSLPTESIPISSCMVGEETEDWCREYSSRITAEVDKLRDDFWRFLFSTRKRPSMTERSLLDQFIKTEVDKILWPLETEFTYKWLYHRHIRSFLWPSVNVFYEFDNVAQWTVKDKSGLAMNMTDLRGQLEQVKWMVKGKAAEPFRIEDPFGFGSDQIVGVHLKPTNDVVGEILKKAISAPFDYQSLLLAELALCKLSSSSNPIHAISLYRRVETIVKGQSQTMDIYKMATRDRQYVSVFKIYEWIRQQSDTKFVGLPVIKSSRLPPHQSVLLLAFTFSSPIDRVFEIVETELGHVPLQLLVTAIVHVYPEWSLRQLVRLPTKGPFGGVLKERLQDHILNVY